MLFEMFSARRRDDAFEALHAAGFDPIKPSGRAGDAMLLEVEAVGASAESQADDIVLRVDPNAKRLDE